MSRPITILARSRRLGGGLQLIAKRFDSSNGGARKSGDITSTTILVQDGIHVQELPMVVKKVMDLSLLDERPERDGGGGAEDRERLRAALFSHAHGEIRQLIRGEFARCNSAAAVRSVLNKCSTITCNIALGALERAFEIDVDEEELFRDLIGVIIKDDSIVNLLRALKVGLMKDEYVSMLCDEILDRVAEGKLAPVELCDAIEFFDANKRVQRLAESKEKLWVGFVQREKELDEAALVRCFRVIDRLRESKKLIVNLLEKRVAVLWWRMKPDSVAEILASLARNDMCESKVLPVIGRWTNTNVHVLSEDLLLETVTHFTRLKYVDAQIEKALERYVKWKGAKVRSHALIVAIMNYIRTFRVRNAHILNGCSEYFIANAQDIDPMFIKSIIAPYGYLNYQPNNGAKFWKALEDALEAKFSKINDEDVIDAMMSCVYLGKHPLNFLSKIFNAHFFERISGAQNSLALQNKLRILDVALSLECKTYEGPTLPKDAASSSFLYDTRIKRLVNNIRDSFESVAGGADCMSTTVAVPGMCISELYVIDVMLHPKGLRSSLLTSSFYRDRNINVAVLIHLPEHFTSNGEILVGPQEMRIRHLRILGLKVVTLRYEILSRLKMHRKELEKYIVAKLKDAQEAF